MMLKEIRARLANLAEDMRTMHAKAEAEDRGFTAEESASWDQMTADFEQLEARAKRLEQVADLETVEDRSVPEHIAGEHGTEREERALSRAETRDTDGYRDAIDTFLRQGPSRLTAEQRSVLERGQVSMGEEVEQRAQAVGSDAAGGFTVPEGFAGYITERLVDFSGLYGAAAGANGPTLLRTARGNLIPFPTNDDTGNAGAILAENAAVPEQDLVFGERTLTAYMYTSDLVRVSLQLLQDEAVNLPQYLGSILGKRIGRALSPHFAAGTGTGQPTGLATAATDGGIDISTAAGVTHVDLLDFEHALDPAYRGRAQWVFNDNTLRAIKGLNDANNRPLWLPEPGASIAQGGAAATLLGYSYIVDQGMADIGTGNRPICFGDLSEFIIREVIGINLFRFAERYMTNLQVAWMAYARFDSNLIDTNAVVTDIGVA